MGIDERNIEQVVKLALAVQQRFAEVQNMANTLQHPSVYRSPRGDLEVGQLTDEDKRLLLGHIITYLDQAEVASAAIRGLIAGGPAPESPAHGEPVEPSP